MTDFEVVDVGEYHRLKQALADCKSENAWISVDDRLPEKDVTGICAQILNGFIENMCAFEYGRFSHIYSGLEASNYDGGASINIDFVPTHWRPIRPPEGGAA